MDIITDYRKIVKELIEAIGARKNKSKSAIRYQVIEDDNTGNYLLIRNGWRDSTRFYTNIIHIEVTADAKVYIHQDNTDLIIADELIEAGIPGNDIILAFNATQVSAAAV